MRLYLTAKGRYAGTQDEAKVDGKGWHLELVPDQKADLIAYLNDKLAAPVEAQPAMPQLADDFVPPVASDGFPEHRVAYSSGLVEAMFKPRPPALRELCFQIGKLNSGDLAHVAFEVAHAFARRGQ